MLAPFLVEAGTDQPSTAGLVVNPLLAPLVELPVGPAVLAPEVKVAEYLKSVQASVDTLEKSRRELAWKQAIELTAAGAALISSLDRWDSGKVDAGLLARARQHQSGAGEEGQASGGRLQRVVADLRERREELEESAWPGVDDALVQVARVAPKTGIPEAEGPRARAARLGEPLQKVERELDRHHRVAAWLEGEMERRQEARRWVNFDCIFHAAYLVAFGPGELTVPVEMGDGEFGLHIAPVATASTTQWFGVPPATPRSFFVEHTGFPYKVGSLWPARLPRSGLVVEDHGNLVLTNRRLVYRGETSAEFPLETIESLDEYDDALVLQASGQTHYFLLLSRPTRFTLLINYLLARRADEIPAAGTSGYDLLGEFLLRTQVIVPPVPIELEEYWASELLAAVQRIPNTLARDFATEGLLVAERVTHGIHRLFSRKSRR